MANDKTMRKWAWFFIMLALSSLAIGIGGTNIVSEVKEFTVAHSNAPTISYVESVTRTPTEATNSTVYVTFNTTDTDGRDNINDSSALVTLTKADVQRNSSSCEVTNITDNMKEFNCSITVAYYDYSGSWTINASVGDNNANKVQNTSSAFTHNELTAFIFDTVLLTFGELSAGAADQGATNDPISMNNTGNQNLTEINITAYDLVGQTTPSYYIGASNFSANVNDAAAGQALINASAVTVTSASLLKNTDGTINTEEIYVYVDVPSSMTAQDYNSSQSWEISVG